MLSACFIWFLFPCFPQLTEWSNSKKHRLQQCIFWQIWIKFAPPFLAKLGFPKPNNYVNKSISKTGRLFTLYNSIIINQLEKVQEKQWEASTKSLDYITFPTDNKSGMGLIAWCSLKYRKRKIDSFQVLETLPLVPTCSMFY